MQSSISTRGILSSNSLGRARPIVFDISLILDIFLSFYYFFFNPVGTMAIGVRILLGLQLIFLPIFILIAYMNLRTIGLNQSITIDGISNGKNIQPLAYTLQIANIETETMIPDHEKKLGLVKTIIYFGFAIDVVIGLNFWLLSFLVSGQGGDGSFVVNSFIQDQVYYLPPILFLIFYYYHLKVAVNQTKDFEVIKGSLKRSTSPITFFSTLKVRKGLRLFIFISFILFLLFIAVFAYARQVEDNNINSYNLHNKGPYGNIQIHGIYESGDKIEVIAHGELNGRPPSHHLLRYTINPDTDEITQLERLPNLPSGYDRVLDSVVANEEIYFLLLDITEWNLLVFKYTFETENMDIIYLWDLGLTGPSKYYEWLSTYNQFVYMLSAYDNGVHLIQTQDPQFHRPEMAIIKSLDSDGITVQQLNLTILDVITHNNKTKIVHISESTTNNFDLTTYNGVGANFSEGSATKMTLPLKYSEDIYGFPTPNSATLFVLDETLYYRSTQNLFDIDHMKSSDVPPNPKNIDLDFANRGLPGVTSRNDLLFLNTGTKIQFTTIGDLKEIDKAIAKNSQYSSSKFSNILISDNKLVTASNNGRIFIWETELKLLIQDRDRFDQLVQIGIFVYFVSSSIYFIVRRKA